jgi:uncharacterized protein
MTQDTQSTIPAPPSSRLARLYGPWAVVTGASSGIGAAAATVLAEAGVNLLLVARRLPELRERAALLRDRYGVEVEVVAADLATAAGMESVEEAGGHLDVGLLVAAAGFGTSGSFVDGDLDEEVEMLQVNCRAVLEATHHFARRFKARNRGGIVLFGSIVGFQGTPYAAHYAATKAYIQTLAEGLRVELAPHGVDVLASAPGPVHTGFAARSRLKMGAALQPEAVARETLAALGRRTTVHPGLLTKVLTGSLSLLPRWGRSQVMGRVMGGMAQPREGAA